MSFLAPLFLAGVAALAAPIFIHLVRRQTRERQEFSSLMFLEQSPPVAKKKTRIEDWLLLALRCLVLALLALAFARPFFLEPPEALAGDSEGTQRLIAIDTSFSMRGEVWDAARAAALSVIDQAKPEDRVAIVALGPTPRTLISFEAWNELPASERLPSARRLVESLSPGFGRNDAAQSLPALAQMILADKGMDSEVHLISDFQRSSGLAQAPPWTADASLIPHRITGNERSLSLSKIGELVPVPEGHQLTLAVQNHSARDRTTNVQLSTGEQLSATVPAGSREILTVSRELPPSGIVAQLEGEQSEPLFVAPPRVPTVKVAAFGSGNAEDPEDALYYLARAFESEKPFRIDFRHGAESALAEADLLIATGPLDEAEMERAKSALADGRSVFVAASSEPLIEQAFELAGEPPPSINRIDTRGDAIRLADIDYGSSVFAPFEDPAAGDFSDLLFWKYFEIDPSGEVLASFQGGIPALLRFREGDGAILLLTSSWKPDDSQLARTTKFAPLLYAIAEATASPESIETQLPAGAVAARPEELGGPIATAGGESPAELPDGSLRFASPGLYQQASGESWFAVNPDPREFDSDYLGTDELKTLGWDGEPAATAETTQATEPASGPTLEGKQQLWRWILLFALFLIIAESFLAARKSKQPTPAAQT